MRQDLAWATFLLLGCGAAVLFLQLHLSILLGMAIGVCIIVVAREITRRRQRPHAR